MVICKLCSNFVRKSKMKVYLSILFALILLLSCSSKKEPEVTPWGTTIGEDESTDSTASRPQSGLSLDDILTNGEMIMLTINGPSTYYDYHNHGMGLQYLLLNKFAKEIGVAVRVEECKDTAEMIRKLEKGEGDVIAYPLSKKEKGDLLFCGPSMVGGQWAVVKGNESLADTLNHWFRPQLIAETKEEEDFMLSTRSITRHVYAPMLNAGKGIISRYDRVFQSYAPAARMDWRLLAAQAYQESTFDPNARSWAGALGLMQIMPSTASHLGLPMSQIHNPESNVAAAAKYMAELQGKFSDIPDPSQRILFALASYNGGFHHIRDAMSLTKKYGGNQYNWRDVSEYVLKLSTPAYYNDPVVKYGYMRGSESVDYVSRIRSRWSQYRGVAGGGSFGGTFHGMPSAAKHKNKYHL